MDRAEQMVPVVKNMAKRFARSVGAEPDDYAQAALLRVCQVLKKKHDVSWAYLWKVVRFAMRTYAFEDNLIKVPMTSGRARMGHGAFPKGLSVKHSFNGQVLEPELQMLKEGHTKQEICEVRNINYRELMWRLKEQWKNANA